MVFMAASSAGLKKIKPSTFVTSRHPITIGYSNRDFSLLMLYPQNGLYSLHTFEGMVCLQTFPDCHTQIA